MEIHGKIHLSGKANAGQDLRKRVDLVVYLPENERLSLFEASILKGNESPTINFQGICYYLGQRRCDMPCRFFAQTCPLKMKSLQNEGIITYHAHVFIWIWFKIENWGRMGDFGHVCPIEELTPLICFDDFLIVITTPNR